MLAMNLLLVGNFSALNPFVMETWTNPEIIHINQDPLGQAAISLNVTIATNKETDTTAQGSGGTYQRATMAECGGEPALQQWVMSDGGQLSCTSARVCLNVEGCKTSLIYDGCTTNTSKACGKNEQFTFNANHQLVSALPGSKCIAEERDRTLSLRPCDSDDPKQYFLFKDGQLTDKAGLCLTAATAPSSGNHIAMGRRLSGDSVSVSSWAAPSSTEPGFAIMFLNNDVTGANIICEADCLRSLGLDSSRTYSIRDVWSHTEIGRVVGDSFYVEAVIPAGGGSRVFRLTEKADDSTFV